MCGIFGIISRDNSINSPSIFRNLFLLSESRGKEAAGFAIKHPASIRVYKTPFPASKLVKSNVFQIEVDLLKKGQFIGIGHSRLVTNGYEQYDINNQPVVKNGMVVIHNGIIVNQCMLWEKYKKQSKKSDLDSELIPAIIKDKLDNGSELGEAVGFLFREIYGMTNIALLSENNNNLLLATNNGSIYFIIRPNLNLFLFASERHILHQLIIQNKLNIHDDLIQQLPPNNVACVNLNSLSFNLTKFGEKLNNYESSSTLSLIEIIRDKKNTKKHYINTSLEYTNLEIEKSFIETYNDRKIKIDNLKRCSKCLLPETFPHISYDNQGICNYCVNYTIIDVKGKSELMKLADKYRRKDGKPECLIPLSGGRDSSYTLHYVIKELGLKPIAFSYDWGMLTDLARRNQARMCGKLGVEHILVSADIRKKRENIRKNVLAWLKHPSLGTIPLFMAGDKQYFYYSKLLKEQNSLDLVIMGENQLEKTLFKSAFSGAKLEKEGFMAYHISTFNKIRMLGYYLKQFFVNPAYINSSIMDTAGSFFSYYGIKHDYTNLFNFIRWDEEIINNLLVKEYDWETDPATKSTWRIGDGTAAFYNYIYYMVAGFTENDTFRSNQIREGILSRQEAMLLSSNENQPRWDSIQWYCKTIGIDFDNTIAIINKIKCKYS